MKLLSVKSGQFLYSVNSTSFDRVACELGLYMIDSNKRRYTRYSHAFRHEKRAKDALENAIDNVSRNYKDFLDELMVWVQPRIEYCKVIRGWELGYYSHSPEVWTLQVSQPSTVGSGVFITRISEISRGPYIYDKSLFKLQRRLKDLVRTPEMLRTRLFNILNHDKSCDELAARLSRLTFGSSSAPWVLSHPTLTDAPIVRATSLVKLSSI